MEERRQFYRITDLVVLEYRVVHEEVLDGAAQQANADKLQHNNVHSIMMFMESRLHSLINQIGRENPALAETLDLMNKKVGLVERLLSAATGQDAKSDTLAEEQTQEVNLSAGGLAFGARTAIAEGACLELGLALVPAYRFIRAFARVVSCREADATQGEFPYWVAVEFEYIEEDDQEFLVQHIFKRQTEALRRRREQRDVG